MAATEQLRGKRILLVEDDLLVAEILIEFLEEAGADVLGPIGAVEEAAAFVREWAGDIDAAVLDLNLDGGKAYPIADLLAARDVKFVFATGGADALDDAYRNYPRCEKPYNLDRLAAALGM